MPPKQKVPTLIEIIEERKKAMAMDRDFRMQNYIDHDVSFPRKQIERTAIATATLNWVLDRIKDLQKEQPA